jgi:pimeloyl-ACP methyl ester carboxylesterase
LADYLPIRLLWRPFVLSENMPAIMGRRSRHAARSLTWIVVTVLVMAGVIAGADAPQSRIELQECRLESPAAGDSVAARCGWLEVPENRENPAGRKVRLHVAVIPALRLQPAPDPLFILAGGPGQAASDYYTTMAPVFGRIRRDRDIVLLDQRGTGRSNRLDCAFDDDDDFADTDPRQLQEQTRACIAALPGDARYFTTSIAVQDLDEVRAALGYRSLNFYAVSYGTRVAQHFIRRHPDRVRTAILDGVVPVDLALGPDIPLQAQRALDALFDRCAADTACNAKFPALRDDFRALRTRLQTTPEKMQIPDPITAAPTSAIFGIPQLSAAVRLLSYSDETASVLPLLIHQAEVDRQPQGMLAQYLMIQHNMESQIANGMHFAVTCSEDSQRWAEQPADTQPAKDAYLGSALMFGMSSICSAWPRGPVDKDFNEPLHSDVPALLLSGGNDPVTPAAYGERAAAGFKHGRHIVLPGQGHGQLAVGCMPRLVAQFIDQRALADSDLKCLQNVAPAPFMLSTTAPGP